MPSGAQAHGGELPHGGGEFSGRAATRASPVFLPANLLAGRRLVPELFQGEVRAERLGPELLRLLNGGEEVVLLERELAAVARSLCHDASATAAEAVLGLRALSG